MRKTITVIVALLCLTGLLSCEDKEQMDSIPYSMTHDSLPSQKGAELAALDLSRAVALVDTAVAHYFTGANMTMLRYYNPVTQTASAEVGSVWMYTSAIEAVNSVMESLKDMQKQVPDLYTAHYSRLEELLTKLYAGLDYYAGTYTLTSYTQTRQWRVFSVNRASDANGADVKGTLNVYDDQEWLIRELIRSYKITGKQQYLTEAEYLTDYVLDGWDCSPNANGDEVGGITWGPAYVSKHSCSNGPMVAPLIWLYEIYRGKSDEVTYRKIDLNGKRYEVTEKKTDYYMEFAKKIYDWQKTHLMMDSGVYYDLVSANGNEPQYEDVDGVTYRKSLALGNVSGEAYTYNSGTMLSGGAELYRTTRIGNYLTDLKALTTATFTTFAKKNANQTGYYSYPVDGFSTWFNDVLMRGYAEAYNQYDGTREALTTFQNNLDFAWANYLKNGMLPVNLLVGWSWTSANNNIESMYTFAYAAEYAVLANYQRKVYEE